MRERDFGKVGPTHSRPSQVLVLHVYMFRLHFERVWGGGKNLFIKNSSIFFEREREDFFSLSPPPSSKARVEHVTCKLEHSLERERFWQGWSDTLTPFTSARITCLHVQTSF